MTRLSQSQLAMYAAAAGAANPQLAAAVAMAETRGTGETTSHNIIPPDDSYGPWQINMFGSLGPERRKQFGITSNSQLFDIATNAKAMVAISKGGTDFTPWSTYQDGSYKKYVAAGTNAQNAGWLDTLTGGIESGIDPLGTLAGIDPLQNLLNGGQGVSDAFSFVGNAASWVSKASNWLRVGYVVGGGILVIVGLAMVAKDQELKVIAGSAGKVLGGQGKALGGKVKSQLKGAK